MRKSRSCKNGMLSIEGMNDNELLFAVEPSKPKARVRYLDVMRVIACIAVVMIHVSATYVKKDIGSFNFWVGDVLNSISRVAVPLFVMISGALMLDEKYGYQTNKLIRHIKKLVIFYIFWSLFYSVVFNIVGPIMSGKSVSIMRVFASFIQGHYHLWFIYLIIGLYLILPLLRLWVKRSNKKYIEYFIVLAIIFAFILPQIASVGSKYSDYFSILDKILEEKVYLKYVGGFTAYFVLGWYINNYNLRNKRIIYLLGILGPIVTMVGTYILSSTTGKILQMDNNLSLNVLLPSVAVFVFAKSKFASARYRGNRIIDFVSKNSLGIYAIHALIIKLMYELMAKVGCDVAAINIPIIFFVAFGVSLFVSFVLSKIPVLKRIV